MVASFVLFIINIWRRGWTLPILGDRPLGAHRGGRRRDLPAVRAARAGGAERAREGAALHRPEHRGHDGGDGAERRRGHPLRAGGVDPTAVDLAGNADTIRQHPDLGSQRQHPGQHLRAAAGHPRLLRREQRRRRSLRAQRRADPGAAVRARPQRRRHPAQELGGRAPHLHPRLRRHRGAGQREGGERRAVLRGRGHPLPRRGRRARPLPAGRLLRRGPGRLRRGGLQAARDQLRGRGRDEVHDLRGRGRRRARQRGEEGGVRAPVRRPQPADLRPAHRQLEAALHPRHPRAGVGPRPVPRSRRRSVSRDPRRTDRVDRRRLHDDLARTRTPSGWRPASWPTRAASTTPSTTCATP